MHQSVVDAFADFSVKFEGRVNHMYLDVLGLVTTGVGNLIDPVSEALKLPWKLGNGDALPSEIRADWAALKARQDLKTKHHKYAADVTRIRLTEGDINTLVISKLLANERILRRDFPRWDEMTADAQLAICSMSWALGAGFAATFKNFARAAAALDYAGMKAACKINAYDKLDANGKRDPRFNPGVIPRNKANELCLENAAHVAAHGGDPRVLHWPNSASDATILGLEPIAPPRPEALAGGFSVADSIVADGLRDMSRDTEPPDSVPPTLRDPQFDEPTNPDTPRAKSEPPGAA